MKKSWSIGFALYIFSTIPLRLSACVADMTPPGPSLVDPNIVSTPLFKFEDRLNFRLDYGEPDLCTATLLEWQDYFNRYKKIHVPLSRIAKTLWKDELSAPAIKFIRDKENLSPDLIENAEPLDLEKYPDVEHYKEFMKGGFKKSDSYALAAKNAKDKTLDPFLRAKWAFQTVRFDVMGENYAQGISDYDHLMAPLPIDSLIHYRGLSYKARAFYMTNQSDQPIDLYLDLFDQCPGMRSEGRNSLRVLLNESGAFNKLLQRPMGPHRKVVALYVMNLLGSRDYSVETLGPMIKNGPREISTEMTMVRMLQDVEEDYLPEVEVHLLGRKSASDDPSVLKNISDSFFDLFQKYSLIKPPDPAHLTALLDLAEEAAINPKIRRPAFWYWAAGYLSLLAGDSARAEKNYDHAATLSQKDDSLTHSIHLLGSLVSLTRNQETFPGELQKSLLDDLAWAHAQNQAKPDDPKRDPDNPRLEATLEDLVTEKFMYLGDWGRAILCTSLTPDSGYYELNHVECLLELASVNDLLKTRGLLYEIMNKDGNVANGQPLDGFLAQTTLTPQDLSFYLAIRKAKNFSYQEAADELEKLQKQDPDYLHPAAAVDMNAPIPIEGTYRTKSKWIDAKQIAFGGSKWGIDKMGDVQKLDMLSYFKKMALLQDQLAKSRKTNPKREAETAFELAVIYTTQQWTGWPEFRAERHTDGTITYAIAPDDFGFPFQAQDIRRDFYGRWKAFVDETPDYYQTASKYFQEVVDSKGDKELAARSIACLASINFGVDKVYPQYLNELKINYKDTDFYKRYQPTCSWLK